MTVFTKFLAGAAGVAALATAAPAAAQYYGYQPGYASPYGYSGYNNGYGYNGYGYNAGATNMATQQCASAVQSSEARRIRGDRDPTL